jgi:predicted flap endonuclease-1-like 5' DNA nuclease
MNLNQLLSATAWAIQADEPAGGLPWWAWLLIFVVLVVIALLLWSSMGRSRPEAGPPAQAAPAMDMPAEAAEEILDTPVATMPVAPPPAVPIVPPAPPEPDDLAILEGIGPRIAGVLQAAGITSFADLAAADVAHLEGILRDAQLPFSDPGSWREQARLAAAGQWDELKALQDSLKGGRTV